MQYQESEEGCLHRGGGLSAHGTEENSNHFPFESAFEIANPVSCSSFDLTLGPK